MMYVHWSFYYFSKMILGYCLLFLFFSFLNQQWKTAYLYFCPRTFWMYYKSCVNGFVFILRLQWKNNTFTLGLFRTFSWRTSMSLIEMHSMYTLWNECQMLTQLLEIAASGEPVSPFELCCLSSLCLELIAEESCYFSFSFWGFLI